MIGNATEREVASRATMSVMVVKDKKARMNRHPGLKSSLGECSDGGFDDSGEWIGVSFSDSEGGLAGVVIVRANPNWQE